MSARLLEAGLRAWWGLVAEEADGHLPSLATVAARAKTVNVAWRAMGDPAATATYWAVREVWEAKTGRCAVTGRVGACEHRGGNDVAALDSSQSVMAPGGQPVEET